MRRIITKMLSFFKLPFSSSEKGTPSYPTQLNGKSLLWEVSENGLSSPSYFLGTMHLMCAEDAALSSNVKKIVKEVGQVYFEADINSASELLGGMLTLQAKESETLQQVLQREEYERVKDFFDKCSPSVPFEVLEKQYPLMLQSSLYELLLPCEQKNGTESLLMEETFHSKKEIKGLETLEFQASVFDNIPYKDQAYELLSAVDTLPKHKQNLEQLIEVYKQQDIDKLHEFTAAEESGVASHLELLLYSRNREWVNQFEPIAKSTSTLFAVGAGHLGGADGVIQLLKNKGFKVRPLVN